MVGHSRPTSEGSPKRARSSKRGGDRSLLVEGVLPRHVTHCQHYPKPSGEWWLWVWDPENPATKVRVPYSCRSWRCETCRRHEAAVTFSRIREALDGYEPSDLVFWTLTIDREGYFGGRRWKDEREAYKRISDMSRKLWKRVSRLCDRYGWERPGSRWVGSIEAHRSGWPHYHVVMVAPQLAQAMREQRAAANLLGLSEREGKLVQGELLSHVVASGWGRQSTCEAVEGSRESMADYLTKVAGDHEAAQGELAKLTQLPLNAPVKTRRIRSGKGFLPARRKSTWTGVLLRRRLDLMSGGYDVSTMNVIKRRPEESAVEYSTRYRHVVDACQYEEREADRERDIEAGHVLGVEKWNDAALRIGAPHLMRRKEVVVRYVDGKRQVSLPALFGS